MNYIILDLEWDSVYCRQKSKFINQIIQIGAVKLDENFSYIDKFEATVCSCLSRKLTKRFIELTGITNDDMRAGIPFEMAVESYNNWAGNDIVTLTWSNSDLYAIIENMEIFSKSEITFKIDKYVDLQSYVQNELRLKGNPINNQISLSAAAEKLGINTEGIDLHTAVGDSLISALILRETYSAERFSQYVRDARDPEFVSRLTFKNYYISKINDSNIDKNELIFHCDICGKKAERQSKWRYRNHWFTAQFICRECGNTFSGRILFKKTYNSVNVKKKLVHADAEKKEKGQQVDGIYM